MKPRLVYKIFKFSAIASYVFALLILPSISIALDAQARDKKLQLDPGSKLEIISQPLVKPGAPQEITSSLLNQPPQIQSVTPEDNAKFVEGEKIDIIILARDPEKGNLKYRYLVDGEVIQDWIQDNSFSWQTQAQDVGLKTITVEAKDDVGLISRQQRNVFLYRRVPKPE